MVHHEVSTISVQTVPGCHDGYTTAAQFNSPSAVAVDREGNLIVLDSGNNRVRKVSPGGVVSTLAGHGKINPGFRDGRGTNAKFNFQGDISEGLALDSNGNIFLADIHNHRIRKISPDGLVSTLAGTGTKGHRDGPAESAVFSLPSGVAVDNEGTVFVSDSGNHCIRRITRDGHVDTIAGKPRNRWQNASQGFADGQSVEALFRYPSGLSVNHFGFIFVADCDNYCIRRISPEGDVTTVAGNGLPGNTLGPNALSSCLNEPAGCAVDGDGNVIISDFSNKRVLKLTTDGQISCLAGRGTEMVCGNLSGRPCGIAIDLNGNVIVCDFDNHCLRLIAAGLTPPDPFTRQAEAVVHNEAPVINGNEQQDPEGDVINVADDEAEWDIVDNWSEEGVNMVPGNVTEEAVSALTGTAEGSADRSLQTTEAGFEDENDILSFLESLTLDPQFSDVKVHVGEETFHAHAAVLSRSPFFKTALARDFLEGSHREVTMAEMEPDTFRHVLNYIYTDKVDFSSDINMLQLHAAAEFLGLSKLKRTCESEILESLSVENVIQYFRLATKYSSDVLKRRCVEIASESVSSLTRVMLTTEYVDIMQNDLELHQDFVQACNTA